LEKKSKRKKGREGGDYLEKKEGRHKKPPEVQVKERDKRKRLDAAPRPPIKKKNQQTENKPGQVP